VAGHNFLPMTLSAIRFKGFLQTPRSLKNDLWLHDPN
jgi:hypothetical protein